MDNSFIQGQSVFFIGVEEADGRKICKWLNNPNVTYYLEMGRKPFRFADFQKILHAATQADGDVVFVIHEASTKNAIGFCGLHAIDWVSRRCQLNIIIGEENCWSQGLGSESCELLLKYAFDKLNLNSVQLGVNANNHRAIKAYEKAGFVQEGTRREFLFCNGQYCDMMVFSVLRTEYSVGG